MGSIIKAVCGCGFESENIFAGGGFMNFMTNLTAPALCQKCQSFLVSNYLDKGSKCSKCGGTLLFYNDPSLQIVNANDASSEHEQDVFSWRHPDKGREFRLIDTLYLCPKCKEMKMKFIGVGCWD
jgi:DNA-directed RNA polymerase subunit M/transcription elongation factor TFIIS